MGGEWDSITTWFKKSGFLVLGAGKTWHWGPGPGDQWHDDPEVPYWPDSTQFQKLVRHERALQNSTVTPMDLPPTDFIDAQIASHATKIIKYAAANRAKTGQPFFVASGFHLPHEPYVFPEATWKLYDKVTFPGLEIQGLVFFLLPVFPAYSRTNASTP